PDAVRIAAFGYNEIVGRDAARIANGKRERLDRIANGTPNLHNGKTSPKKRLGLAWQKIAHALRPGPFGVVVMHARHDLANSARLAQIIIGRTQRVIEYKYPRGASLGFNEIFDLRVIDLAHFLVVEEVANFGVMTQKSKTLLLEYEAVRECTA